MNPIIAVTEPWHATQAGCLSLTLSDGMYTVRVVERHSGGVFQRVLYRDGRQHWGSLLTKDQAVAEERARQFLIALRACAGGQTEPAENAVGEGKDNAGKLPLYRLCRLFEQSNSFAALDEHTQAGYASVLRILCGSFGGMREVKSITKDCLLGHATRRKAGGIVYYREKHVRRGDTTRDVMKVETDPVRNRAVALDFQVLLRMMRWATETRDAKGDLLLDALPIVGEVKLPREATPKRPHADFERLQCLLKAAEVEIRKATHAENLLTVRRMQLLSLALMVVNVSGRRIGAISQLRRNDFKLNEEGEYESATIRWRSEADKREREFSLPIPSYVAREIHGQLTRINVVGEGYVFALLSDPSSPVPANDLGNWLVELEKCANVEHLAHGRWHPYRRKWATERKTMPVADVMAAGGWEDYRTFLQSYNRADEETTRRVVEAPFKQRAEVEAARARQGSPTLRLIGSTKGRSGAVGRRRAL